MPNKSTEPNNINHGLRILARIIADLYLTGDSPTSNGVQSDSGETERRGRELALSEHSRAEKANNGYL